MNNQLVFLIISTSILVLSAIVICVAPIMNNIQVDNWKPSNLGNLNCKIFADEEKKENVELDKIQKMRKMKNLCYRLKAIYGLEYSTFILDLILSFICANLALFHYLNVGENFVKKTGLIGLISGVVGFILTFIYVVFSGYIFTNDPAYRTPKVDNTGSSPSFYYDGPSDLIRLFPNGAKYKWNGINKYITVYENEKGDFVQYVKYKDLGQKQYNYNTDYYKNFKANFINGIIFPNHIEYCNIDHLFTPAPHTQYQRETIDEYCDCLYYKAPNKVENKYIYDRWLTALILAVIIFVFNIALAIFGFLLFKANGDQKSDLETAPIISNK